VEFVAKNLFPASPKARSTDCTQICIAGKIVLVVSKPQALGKRIKIVVAMHCFTYTYQPPTPEGETSLRWDNILPFFEKK
jgi:hypothetical protein